MIGQFYNESTKCHCLFWLFLDINKSHHTRFHRIDIIQSLLYYNTIKN